MSDDLAQNTLESVDHARVWSGVADDTALQAWRQIARTYLLLQRRVEALAAARGLAMSQFEALVRIDLNPGMSQQDLANALLLTKGNIGALVDRLERMDLLERRPDVEDKRLNRLFLTQQGRQLMCALFNEYLPTVRKMMSPLADNQQRQIRALLELLTLDMA